MNVSRERIYTRIILLYIYNSAGTLCVAPEVLTGLSANERKKKEDKRKEDCFSSFLLKKVTNLVFVNHKMTW